MDRPDRSSSGGESLFSGPGVCCPQCGGLVQLPHQEQAFACPWCGSLLVVQQGVRISFLVDRALRNQDSARQVLSTWLVGLGIPVRALPKARIEVGPVSYVAFLRVRRTGSDYVRPLTPVSEPELVDLVRVPADLEPVVDWSFLSHWVSEYRIASALREAVQEAMEEAVDKSDLCDVSLEFRSFYPVMYEIYGKRYHASVPAAGGSVLAWHRPALKTGAGERSIAAAAALLLFGEAWLVPGLALKLVLILVTAIILFFALRALADRYG